MTLVIKLGGSAGIDNSLAVDDLAGLWPEKRIVMVHGANAELDAYIRSQGREPTHVTSSRGQVSRYTDDQTMSDMMAIYAGQTNKRIVELFQQRGVNAVGLTAMDGGTATRAAEEHDPGRRGWQARRCCEVTTPEASKRLIRR